MVNEESWTQWSRFLVETVKELKSSIKDLTDQQQKESKYLKDQIDSLRNDLNQWKIEQSIEHTKLKIKVGIISSVGAVVAFLILGNLDRIWVVIRSIL